MSRYARGIGLGLPLDTSGRTGRGKALTGIGATVLIAVWLVQFAIELWLGY